MVNAIRPEFDNEVAFVRANIHTPEGQAFADKHGVSYTTLVFLDANGERLSTLHGEQDKAELRSEIKFAFKITE